MDDDPDVRARPHGPEVFIPRLVEAVEVHARIRRVHLEVESRGLDRLLLLAVQSGEAIREGIGDEELHGLDHSLGWKSGIALFMKALKSGTVKAISPQAGLLVESMFYPVVLGYTENQV